MKYLNLTLFIIAMILVFFNSTRRYSIQAGAEQQTDRANSRECGKMNEIPVTKQKFQCTKNPHCETACTIETRGADFLPGICPFGSTKVEFDLIQGEVLA
jgi:hypothetical protein